VLIGIGLVTFKLGHGSTVSWASFLPDLSFVPFSTYGQARNRQTGRTTVIIA